MADLDPATIQWREMFSKLVAGEFQHNREILDEIRALVKAQNHRIQGNTLAIATKADAKDCQGNMLEIARLKTWVALMGTGVGLIGIGAALLQAMK